MFSGILYLVRVMILPALAFLAIFIVGGLLGALVAYLAKWPIWTGGVAAIVSIIPGYYATKAVASYYEKLEEKQEEGEVWT